MGMILDSHRCTDNEYIFISRSIVKKTVTLLHCNTMRLHDLSDRQLVDSLLNRGYIIHGLIASNELSLVKDDVSIFTTMRDFAMGLRKDKYKTNYFFKDFRFKSKLYFENDKFIYAHIPDFVDGGVSEISVWSGGYLYEFRSDAISFDFPYAYIENDEDGNESLSIIFPDDFQTVVLTGSDMIQNFDEDEDNDIEILDVFLGKQCMSCSGFKRRVLLAGE